MTLLPEPRSVRKIIGHQEALKEFRAAFSSGRLHHGWLITGPEGIGKASLAFHLARVLLNGEDFSAPAGRRITVGTHGDLLEIARAYDAKKEQFKKEITVADVQPVQSFFHQTAMDGGWRVVIIDGAEYLNRFAANALLKVLEEPPAKTVMLLTTSAPGRLLPTLRSRCRLLSLSPLSDQEMKTLLPAMDGALLRKAGGSPGRALFLSQDKKGEIASLLDCIFSPHFRMDNDFWQKISSMTRDERLFALFCDGMSAIVAQKAREILAEGNLAQSAMWAEKYTALSGLWQKLEQFNLDKMVTLREAFALVTP
ncbi:DNA polymerase III subunit delta' [Acetobacteraceae bacterium ESL0709]|nr:DNA polymerase III subunit delta' [Acetobacteraceae bacterium ESL0697]MDF7678269.1 DNA polymerase III subunit delta' [Acetobacteraceae bacterium ESL0709]